MKKIILFLSAIAIMMSSCAEKEAFTINGKLPNGEYNGQQVYLQTLADNWKDRVNIDTANIVDEQFIFKGLAKEGPMLHFIVLDNAPESWKIPVMVVVEPGEIDITIDSISTIKGTPINNAYQAFVTKSEALNNERKALYEKSLLDTANVELQADLEKQFEEKNKERTDATYEFVKANISNQVGAYLLSRNYYLFSLDQMKEVMPSISPALKSNERIQKIEANVNALDATSVGKQFVDVKGKTPEGTDAALSDYAGKGKYVLVDFWASWCGPCVHEMPTLVEAYEQYKDKGFEIVGISLDREGDAWKNGIKKLNMTWPQISDLKFWDSELSAAYGISSIPHTVLLDKDGKIIARGLYGKGLTEKIAELFE